MRSKRYRRGRSLKQIIEDEAGKPYVDLTSEELNALYIKLFKQNRGE
jgi:hypothetical protein